MSFFIRPMKMVALGWNRLRAGKAGIATWMPAVLWVENHGLKIFVDAISIMYLNRLPWSTERAWKI